MEYTKTQLEEALAYWQNVRFTTRNAELKKVAHERVGEFRAALKAMREEAECQAEHEAWERANAERNYLSSLGDR